MPELAEVECMRRRWDAGVGDCVTSVELHARSRVFRDCDTAAMKRQLTGARLFGSERSGKQLMFRLDRGWVALHAGMTGELHVQAADWCGGRHEHLLLRQKARTLVFSDPRMFGHVLYTAGDEPPEWWKARPPEILDRRFTRAALASFLKRRSRAPIKAVLLMQEQFPGIGNWMADEVLWRAGIHPARQAGTLDDQEVRELFRALRFVCRGALRSVVPEANGTWGDPPKGWLFHVRWKPGGTCPLTGAKLRHDTIGGRTTCWSPGRQEFR